MITLRPIGLFSQIAAFFSAGVGVLVLFGWLFDVGFLKSGLPGLATMEPATAICFILAGVATWLLRESARTCSWQRIAGQLLAVVVLAAGVLALTDSTVEFPAGKMARNTAAGFALLGSAVLLLDKKTRRGHVPSQLLALLAALVAYMGLLAYVLRPLALSRVASDTGMAIHTAAALGILACGVLFARPQAGWAGLITSDTPGGFLLRRLLPLMIAVPLPVSWLRLMGQRAGWYTSEFAVTIPAAATVVFFFALILWAARSLNHLAGQREQAEKSAEQSRVWLSAVFEGSRDGICVEENERIVFANRAYAQLYGYDTPEEITGKHLSLLHSPEDNERLLEYGRRRVEGKHAPATYEFRGLKKGGKQIMVEASVSLFSVGGKPYIISMERDVTERKAFEAQLRQAQKMEAVGQLAGGVAHDFNNLLAVILGYVEILMNQPALRSVEQLVEIKKASQRAADLTRQLLAFSRQQVIEPTILNLNTVIADCQKLLARLLPANIELRFKPGPQSLNVKADRTQMEQVLLNLAVNARDAMPAGGTLAIETLAVELGEAYAQGHYPVTPGAYAMLAVTDSGVGMDKETQSRIFEPFFTTKERDKGTGLGLATVYGIVKQSGGYIWVYSEPGVGTTFKIYLPRVDVLEEKPQVTAKPELLEGAETVLLVEDSAALRELFRESLENHGYKVLDAANGPEALEVADEYGLPVDILVTDVIMPVMGGSELAQRLREKSPKTKILYISGYPGDTVARQVFADSSAAFLQKPFGPADLVRKVRQQLDATRA